MQNNNILICILISIASLLLFSSNTALANDQISIGYIQISPSTIINKEEKDGRKRLTYEDEPYATMIDIGIGFENFAINIGGGERVFRSVLGTSTTPQDIEYDNGSFTLQWFVSNTENVHSSFQVRAFVDAGINILRITEDGEAKYVSRQHYSAGITTNFMKYINFQMAVRKNLENSLLDSSDLFGGIKLESNEIIYRLALVIPFGDDKTKIPEKKEKPKVKAAQPAKVKNCPRAIIILNEDTSAKDSSTESSSKKN
jgi:hypothetical protein